MSRSRQVKNRYDHVREILGTIPEFPPVIQQMILDYFAKDFLRLRDPVTGEQMTDPRVCVVVEALPIYYDNKTWKSAGLRSFLQESPFLKELIRFVRLSPDGKFPVPPPDADNKNDAKSMSVNTHTVDATTPLISSLHRGDKNMEWTIDVKKEHKQPPILDSKLTHDGQCDEDPKRLKRYRLLHESKNYLLNCFTDDKAYQKIKTINLARDLKCAFDKEQKNNRPDRHINIHSILNATDEPICLMLPRRELRDCDCTMQAILHIFLSAYFLAISHPKMFYDQHPLLLLITIPAELANISLEYQSAALTRRINVRDINGLYMVAAGIFAGVFFLSDIPSMYIFEKRCSENSPFLERVDHLSWGIASLSILGTGVITTRVLFKLIGRLRESQPSLPTIFKKLLYAVPWMLPYLVYAKYFDYGFYDSDLDSFIQVTNRYIAPLPILFLGGMQLTDEIREHFHLKNPREEFVMSLMENREATFWQSLAKNVQRFNYLLCFFILSLLESTNPGSIENIGIALLYALTFLPKMAIPEAVHDDARPFRYLSRVNLFAEQNRVIEVDEEDEKDEAGDKCEKGEQSGAYKKMDNS